jgi:hypothetical protein
MSYPERQFAPWLPLETPVKVRALIERAGKDIGIAELPRGSNRSERIDEYNRMASLAEDIILAGKGYWCASAVGAWWVETGWEVPKQYYSCDSWLWWAKKTNRFSQTPSLGCAVLYGKGTDARHIGLVIRVVSYIFSVEGNTSIESGFNREGTGVAMKEVTLTDPVIGYVALTPPPPRQVTV